MDDEELLGKIAFEWRGTCVTRTGDIHKFMDDYAQAVNRLIKSGKWVDSPPPEDQLPHDMMPRAFFDYWNVERKPVLFKDPEPYAPIIIGIAFWIALIGGVFLFISVCRGTFFLK